MAIAFRAAGARLKADIGISGASQSAALPAGHVSGDLLLLFVLSDDNTNLTTTPAGWTLLLSASPSTATRTPYNAPARLEVYYRIDTGALGSTVALTYSASTWPAGAPWTVAFTAAYSGVDTAGPIERWAYSTTASATAAQAHPAVSAMVTGDWLLTFRASSAYADSAFTTSSGTDVERVDDNDGFGELSCALYDSGAAVTTGAQPVRTTTLGRSSDYGSTMMSIVLKAPGTTSSASASAGTATATARALGPTVATQDGPWDLCGSQPVYRFTIDWDGLPGALNANPDFEDAGGWTAYGPATFARSQVRAHRGVWSGLLTTGAGSGNRAEADKVPVTPGRLYRASGYTWAESAMPAGVSFSVNWYDAGAVYLSTSSNVFVPVVGDWQYADGFFPAPASAALAGVLLDTSGTPGAGLHLWGDEVRLDDWSALADPAAVVGAGEDVTSDIVSDITVTYGRDQERQLAQASVGSAAFTLTNTDRRYSPENAVSPLYGDIDPARVMLGQVAWSGATWPLFRGRIDDYTLKTEFSDRTVDLTFLDGLNDLSGVKLSTRVYATMRTGELVNVVLDEAGWTGPRDIDPGATVVAYWWADGTDAFAAVNDLVKSEGPPAIAYVDPDGTFVFRDRHHRLLRPVSLTAQASLHAGTLGDCTSAGVPEGSLSLARPFTYAHGWKDIVNSVSFDALVRVPSADLTPVWTDTSSYTIALGQSLDLTVSTSDAFTGAVTPVVGTDITATGVGTLTVLLSRTSGASARLTLTAVGGPVVVTSVQVRGHLIETQQTVRVSAQDPGSVGRHGERTYNADAPWAGPEDARAIAGTVLLHYAQRRPTVQLRLVAADPAHYVQVLSRTVSDRIHVVNEEMGLDDDFFVERVAHTVRRTGRTGQAPVHSVVLSCEKDMTVTVNPFTFDLRGAGFDQGVFDRPSADNPTSVFIFDDPVQGQFDQGVYGT